MRDLALVLELLDRADVLAQESGNADLNREARRIVRAHPDAELPVEHVVAALRQEIAKSRGAPVKA